MRVMIFFVSCIFLCSGVFAISGVNPRSYEINFEPNYSADFNFNFVIDGNLKVDLYAEGDLSEYVSLNKKKIFDREKVVASLNLPSEVDSPGVNQIRIVAGDVVGVIKINVPYPDKYVELRLSAPNINIGEIVNVSLNVFSRGNDSVMVEPRIEIYKDDKKLETIEISGEEIGSRESRKFNIFLNTSNYSVGDYLTVAIVDYNGRVTRVENLFRVGESSVKILDYTRKFRENKVDKFEIEIESLWNSNMDDLYIEVNVLGLEDIGFVTPVIKLGAWRKAIIAGFLDTTNILDNEFEAEIILHYEDEINSQIVQLKISKGFDYTFYGVLIGCIVILGFSIWRGKIFVRKYKKYKYKK